VSQRSKLDRVDICQYVVTMVFLAFIPRVTRNRRLPSRLYPELLGLAFFLCNSSIFSEIEFRFSLSRVHITEICDELGLMLSNSAYPGWFLTGGEGKGKKERGIWTKKHRERREELGVAIWREK
jgi:hypothetical protein